MSVNRISADGGNLYIDLVNKRFHGAPQDAPKRCHAIEVARSDLADIQNIYYKLDVEWED